MDIFINKSKTNITRLENIIITIKSIKLAENREGDRRFRLRSEVIIYCGFNII